MITRQAFWHPYAAVKPGTIRQAGFIRVTQVNNVTNTWAIARPLTAPDPNGSPFYLGYGTRANDLAMSGFQKLKLRPSRVEMDPSDSTTWQRSYRFT